MRGRIDYRLLCASQADAVWVRDWVNTEVSSRPKYADALDPDRPAVATMTRDGWAAVGGTRFEFVGDERAILDRITRTWQTGQQGRRILAGSWVEVHACPHDEPVVTPCPEPTRAVK